MLSNRQPNILVFETPEELALAAAQRFVALGQERIRTQRAFSVALAGGSTPRRLYQLLAATPFATQVEWSMVHVFFGDERPVPHDDSDSNFRMAHNALLSQVPIPPENVHRIVGEGDALENARSYERELRTFFGESDWPRFDLVLLGMGRDGHTASLFPHTAALKEDQKWVVANWIESLNSYRITLSAPCINAASNVEFLVSGEDKAPALATVLEGPRDPNNFPAQLVKPDAGELIWLVDVHAAARLSGFANKDG